MHQDTVIAATRLWLEKAVIGLNLCPFAKAVYLKDYVRFVVSAAPRRTWTAYCKTWTVLQQIVTEVGELTGARSNKFYLFGFFRKNRAPVPRRYPRRASLSR